MDRPRHEAAHLDAAKYRPKNRGAGGTDLATKPKRRKIEPPKEPAFEISPGFAKRVKPKVIKAAPPEIPRNAIRVLRREPVIIEHEPIPPTAAPRPRTFELPPAPLQGREVEVPRTTDKPQPARPPSPPRNRPKERISPPREERRLARPAPEPPPAPAETNQRPRALTRTGLFGVAAATLALGGLLFSLLLPWVTYDPAAGPSPIPGLPEGRLGRSDLGPARDAHDYVDSLVTAPTILYALILAVGVCLAALDELPRVPQRLHRLGQAGLLIAFTALGFLHTLYGMRWFGLYTSTILDDGPTAFHLHIVPYLNLGIGAFVFGGALVLLRRRRHAPTQTPFASRIPYDDVELPLWTVVTIALALLLVPLLPIGISYAQGGAAAAGEGELAIAPPEGLKDASRDLDVCMILLWSALWLNVVCLGIVLAERVAPLETLHSAFVFAYAMNGLLALVGLVFTMILAFDVYDPPRVVPSINFVPAGAFIALAVLWWLFFQQALRPFLQAARSRPL